MKDSCIQEHLNRHFSTPCHMGFLNDVSDTLTDKTETMTPYGLKIDDSV